MFLEEQQWYCLIHSWEDKGDRTFSQGICPKVNVIVQLEFKLAYYDSPKFQDWGLAIRLFSVIFRTLIGVCVWGGVEVLTLCRDAVSAFYSPNRLC